jgi:hypothetical protein
MVKRRGLEMTPLRKRIPHHKRLNKRTFERRFSAMLGLHKIATLPTAQQTGKEGE